MMIPVMNLPQYSPAGSLQRRYSAGAISSPSRELVVAAPTFLTPRLPPSATRYGVLSPAGSANRAMLSGPQAGALVPFEAWSANRSTVLVPSVTRVDPEVVSSIDPRAAQNTRELSKNEYLHPPAVDVGVKVQKPGKVSPWFDRDYMNMMGNATHEWYCYIYPSMNQFGADRDRDWNSMFGAAKFVHTQKTRANADKTKIKVEIRGSEQLESIIAGEVFFTISVDSEIQRTAAQVARANVCWADGISFEVCDGDELKISMHDALSGPSGLATGVITVDSSFLQELKTTGVVDRFVPLVSGRIPGGLAYVRVTLRADSSAKPAPVPVDPLLTADKLRELNHLNITVVDGENLLPGFMNSPLGGQRVFVSALNGATAQSTRSVSAAPGVKLLWNDRLSMPIDISSAQLLFRVRSGESQTMLPSDSFGEIGLADIPLTDGLFKKLKQGPVEQCVVVTRSDGCYGTIKIQLEAEFLSSSKPPASPEKVKKPIKRKVSAKKTPPAPTRGMVSRIPASSPAPAPKPVTVIKRSVAKASMGEGVCIVQRAWVGVEIKLLDNSAGKKKCVVVLHTVMPNSPAQAAGLQPEDIIESWNGKVLRSKLGWDNALKATPIGAQAQLSIVRNGVRTPVLVSVGSTQKTLGVKRTVKTVTRLRYGATKKPSTLLRKPTPKAPSVVAKRAKVVTTIRRASPTAAGKPKPKAAAAPKLVRKSTATSPTAATGTKKVVKKVVKRAGVAAPKKAATTLKKASPKKKAVSSSPRDDNTPPEILGFQSRASKLMTRK